MGLALTFSTRTSSTEDEELKDVEVDVVREVGVDKVLKDVELVEVLVLVLEEDKELNEVAEVAVVSEVAVEDEL